MIDHDNRCKITVGNFDATIVRYPARTQAALHDIVVEQGTAFGPFMIELQDGIDDNQGVPYDLTAATLAMIIGTETPIELEDGDGIEVDTDPTSGKFTFELTAEQVAELTAPRTRYMLIVTKASVTRRWLEGVLVSSPEVAVPEVVP
jgi:hypothetical protein